MRQDQLAHLLKHENPHVLLLQETKCEDHLFPFELAHEHGYNAATCGQKSYNGVAILSKEPLEDVSKGLPGFETEECRYIEAHTYYKNKLIKVASVYVPNGNPNGDEAKAGVKAQVSKRFQYKLDFLEALRARLKHGLDDAFIIGGDMNVAPGDLDVYSVKNWEGKVCFLPEEKAKFKSILNLGFADSIRTLAPHAQMFSWYDYRTKGFDTGKGLRIDHFLSSPEATDALRHFKVLDYYRGLEKPSDHVPMQIELMF